ncbi:MAG: signal peptidase II [bacterium]|nr:signal peptidase II [bacterium]
MRASIALTFLTDIVVKIWVRQHPATAGRFAFWTSAGPLGIVPSTNDVLAFSLPIPNIWIWPVGWIVVFLLLWYARKSGSRVQIAACAIVLGAFSNLIDRTFLGGVTDYLSFTNLFPAFNIADLLILGGIGGWMYGTRRVVGNS